jgi:hypothetical protein
MHQARTKLAAAVQASGTTLTEIFGVGPASPPSSSARPVTRRGSPAGTPSPPATAPRRSRCPPATAKSTGCPGAATGVSITPCTWPRLPRSATGPATAAPTTTRRSPGAKPPRRRCGLSSARSATPSTGTSQQTQPARLRAASRAREGTRGTALSPARPAHTPNTGSSAKPLPDLPPPYDPGPGRRRRPPHALPERQPEPLDAKRSRYALVLNRGRVGGSPCRSDLGAATGYWH